MNSLETMMKNFASKKTSTDCLAKMKQNVESIITVFPLHKGSHCHKLYVTPFQEKENVVENAQQSNMSYLRNPWKLMRFQLFRYFSFKEQEQQYAENKFNYTVRCYDKSHGTTANNTILHNLPYAIVNNTLKLIKEKEDMEMDEKQFQWNHKLLDKIDKIADQIDVAPRLKMLRKANRNVAKQNVTDTKQSKKQTKRR